MSAGDLHCSVPGSAAHITVTTARGEVPLPSSLVSGTQIQAAC